MVLYALDKQQEAYSAKMTIRTSEMIINLLRLKKVAKFEDIQSSLGDASRTTTFRYLKHVQYVRSYNYNGCYYTIRDPINFDRLGLYSYGDICFSREGKLDKTVIRLVNESESGLTQRELQDLLKVRVQVLLLEAVRHKMIYREKVEGVYLYLHNDSTIRESQLQIRQAHIDASHFYKIDEESQIDPHVVIKVLLVLIHHQKSSPAEVVRALRGYTPSISMAQVVDIFKRYSLGEIIKKNSKTPETLS